MARHKDDRLWLDRLERMDSGELTSLNLDHLIEDLTDPNLTPDARNPSELELDDHRP